MGKKVIAAGHICLDITPVFSKAGKKTMSSILQPGKLIQMKGVDVHTGGSVANTGLAMKILGADVTLMGKIGKDAFGQVPYYEDKGLAKRGILAVGKQDLDTDSIFPIDAQVEVFGASSDHTIVDLTHADKDYQVGDIIEFKLGYGSLLKLFTSSQYIDREYI